MIRIVVEYSDEKEAAQVLACVDVIKLATKGFFPVGARVVTDEVKA